MENDNEPDAIPLTWDNTEQQGATRAKTYALSSFLVLSRFVSNHGVLWLKNVRKEKRAASGSCPLVVSC
jgi:hypothetical protein